MKPSPAKGKILVIRGGAIGDFILTLPAIAALRKQFPNAHIEVLGYPHIAQLALAGGLVDRVQPIEARALAGFFARNGELSEVLRDYFSEFNVITSYLYDPDEIFQTNVARCAHGQFLIGPHRPNEKEGIHATQVYLKLLERLAIFDADPVPRLKVGQASRLPSERVSASDKIESGVGYGMGRRDACPTLALHPGSGSEKKNWPEAKWAELLQRLVESTRLNLLLIGGEAEGQRLEQLAKIIPTERCVMAKNLPLRELAERLQTCTAFVGHDSGITHLAAAVGLPTLVLWSQTLEEIWRPQGERVMIVKESSGLHTLSVQRVSDQLTRMLT